MDFNRAIAQHTGSRAGGQKNILRNNRQRSDLNKFLIRQWNFRSHSTVLKSSTRLLGKSFEKCRKIAGEHSAVSVD